MDSPFYSTNIPSTHFAAQNNYGCFNQSWSGYPVNYNYQFNGAGTDNGLNYANNQMHLNSSLNLPSSQHQYNHTQPYAHRYIVSVALLTPSPDRSLQNNSLPARNPHQFLDANHRQKFDFHYGTNSQNNHSANGACSSQNPLEFVQPAQSTAVQATKTGKSFASSFRPSNLTQRINNRCCCGECLKAKQNRKETGTKHHTCNVLGCGKSYYKSSHLSAHYRWHAGIKPFKCLSYGCTKSFTRSDELSRHSRTHSDIRNYECPACNKRFKRSDHLAKHRKTHRTVVDASNVQSTQVAAQTQETNQAEGNQPLATTANSVSEGSLLQDSTLSQSFTQENIFGDYNQ